LAPRPGFQRIFQDITFFNRMIARFEAWDGDQAGLPMMWPEGDSG
jgi:hypothetical protein